MRRRRKLILVTTVGGLLALTAGALLVGHWAAAVTQASRTPSVVSGGVDAPQRLHKAFGAAAAIWRGTVVDVTPGREQMVRIGRGKREYQLRRDEVDFEVERVIKGPPVTGTHSIRSYSASEADWLDLKGLQPGQHGLVFINDQGEVVDPLRPIVLLGPGGAPSVPGQAPLEALQQEMIYSLREDVPTPILWDLGHELIGWLGVHYEEVCTPLTQLAASDDDAVAAVGLSGLAMYQDPAAVAALVEMAIAHASDPDHPSRRALGEAHCSSFRNPALAGLIAPLLDTDVYEWRRDALSALREMRSLDDMDRFAAALDEEDPFLQYLGVTGLAWTLREHGETWTKGWGGTYENFRNNRERLVSFWKDWWESEGRARYGKGS